MNKIFQIIKKNLKLLIRSKTSALVVILGPLLMIFLVGLAFDNSNAYNINIGVYSKEYNTLTNSFVQKMTSSNFKVSKQFSEDECIDLIKSGSLHTCIIFSSNFSVGGESNNITFYVDYSKINLVYMILDSLSSHISERSSEISTDITTTLLKKIEDTKKELNSQKPIISALTDANTKIYNEKKIILEKLHSMNLDVDKDALQLDRVKTETSDVSDLTSSVINHYDVLIGGIKGKITSLTKTANKTVVGNTTNEIFASMDQTRMKLVNIQKKLDNKSSTIDSNMDDISLGIDSIKSNLEKAGLARSEGYSELEKIEDILKNNLANIIKLQNSINTINANLGSLQFTNSKDIVTPINTLIKPITTEKSHLNYVFPSLMVLVIMFISILLSSTLVVMEKTSKAYFRNVITPTSDFVFVISTYLTSLLLLLFQIAIILGVAVYFFDTNLSVSFISLLLIIFCTISIFSFLGMLIGYLFASEETATLASISVGSIFLMISNVLLPLESMPAYIVKFAQYNPFIIAESLLKKVLIFSTPIFEVANDIYILVGYCVVLFILIIVVQKLMKMNSLFKYTRGNTIIKQ